MAITIERDTGSAIIAFRGTNTRILSNPAEVGWNLFGN